MSKLDITVSKHGYERAKERQHYNKEQTEKAVMCAITKGKIAKNFRSRERNYLERITKHDCTLCV